MLLWKRYVNNKMAAMRFLHLQQYSHRLNLLYFFILEISRKNERTHMTVKRGASCSFVGSESSHSCCTVRQVALCKWVCYDTCNNGVCNEQNLRRYHHNCPPVDAQSVQRTLNICSLSL